MEAITETAVIAGGRAYEIDCLIYATGFEVGTSYTRRSGYDVFGRDGVSLAKSWEGGVSTFHGYLSRGFPNCFIMSNSQSGFTANYPHMLDEQSRHIAHVLGECRARQARTVEPTVEAEEAWVKTVVDSAIQRQSFQEMCTPGYYNNEGKPSALAARNGPFGLGPIAFVKVLEEWRADGKLAGLDLA